MTTITKLKRKCPNATCWAILDDAIFNTSMNCASNSIDTRAPAHLNMRCASGGPFPVYIAGDAAHESGGRRAHICPDDYGQGIIDRYQSLHPEHNKHADGYCRGMDDRGKNKAYQESYHGVVCREKIGYKGGTVFQGDRCLPDKAQSVKYRSEIKQRLADGLQAVSSDKIQANAADEKDGRIYP